MPAPAKSNLVPVFERLRAILQQSEGPALKPHAEPARGLYSLIGPPLGNYKDGMPVAGVRLGKNYVSYHLMSVYAFPELLKAFSPGLLKHKQGKACFNFKEIDEELFAELADLTRAGFDHFKKHKDKIPWGRSSGKPISAKARAVRGRR